MASEPEFYTIYELSQESGVKVRNIRYYISEELIEAPPERGKYTRSHLLRLRLIKRLSEQFVRLEQIRKWLHRSDGQIEQWLSLNNAEPDILTLTEDARSTGAAEEEVADGGKGARDYIARLLGKQTPTREVLQSRTLNAPVAPKQREAFPRGAQPTTPPQDEEVQKRANAETWQHLSLLEGLELHVRAPATPQIQEFVQRIEELARQLR